MSFSFILNELNHGIFLVILRVQFLVDSGHAIGQADDGILIYRDIGICLAPCLSTGNFGLYFLDNGIKAAGIRAGQVILDLYGFAGIYELLEPDLVGIRQVAPLPLLQQLFDLAIHFVEGLDVRGKLLRYTGMA